MNKRTRSVEGELSVSKRFKEASEEEEEDEEEDSDSDHGYPWMWCEAEHEIKRVDTCTKEDLVNWYTHPIPKRDGYLFASVDRTQFNTRNSYGPNGGNPPYHKLYNVVICPVCPGHNTAIPYPEVKDGKYVWIKTVYCCHCKNTFKLRRKGRVAYHNDPYCTHLYCKYHTL